MLEFTDRTILAVTAHPDDLEWLFGGTICQLARRNRVVHIIATSGNKGTRDPGVDETALAAARRREQMAAAAVTGVQETIFFDLPDGDLAYASLNTLRARLYRAMRNYQPQVLITFDPQSLDPHPDHTTVGRVAFEAGYLHPCVRYFPENEPKAWTDSPACYLLFGTNLPEPCRVNDVTKVFPQKLEALRCHASQTGAGWDGIETALRATAAEYGKRIKAKLGEAYRRLEWVNGELRPV
ncbi:MAG: PIG-L deacetylase family protein [Patescibacteria group bacterium]